MTARARGAGSPAISPTRHLRGGRRRAGRPVLVLASGSPRRRALLALAGIRPRVEPAEVSEAPRPGERPIESALRLAAEKARAVAALVRARGEAAFVLGADTLVVVDDQALGKPADAIEARSMLERLSGREHVVTTGVCIVGPDGAEHARAVSTRVRFRSLGERDLARYLASGEWRGKAGAYAIQGRAGALVTEVHGSVTNVVGLPLAEVVEDLERLGALAPGR